MEPPEDLIVAAQAFIKWFGTWNGENFRDKLPAAQHLCLTGMKNNQIGPCEALTMHVPLTTLDLIKKEMKYPLEKGHPKMRKTSSRYQLQYMNEATAPSKNKVVTRAGMWPKFEGNVSLE